MIQNGIQAKNIRVEVGSGANEIKNRPVFQKLFQKELKPNDLLMVTKIDRCSRNTLEFLKLQDILFKKNITFVALDLPTSVDLATNKLIATTLSGIAEFENNRRKERQKAGIRAAQKEGKYKGRKTVINQTLITKVKDLKEKKNLYFMRIETNIEFLLGSWNIIHHPKVSGKEPQLIFLELTQLNFTKLFKPRNLIGIF